MSSNKYQSPIERNNAFMVKVEDLVREIVIQNNIPYYRIESRMEHGIPMATGVVDGITYLPVIRIITYFEDSVSPIADVLRMEFDVEMEQQPDPQNIKVDSFSSKHVEYKVALKANRLELIEYKRYGHKTFEIQVCSMIQDAWNGIEKELGYNGGSIPDDARRDFYRVGALLEMADLEFLKIRSLLNKPEEEQAPATAQPATAAPEPAPVAAAPQPQPQAAAAPVQQQPKPATNIFVSQPISYQPEPAAPAPVAQQPVAAPAPPPAPAPVPNGVAPQRAMPVNNIAGISPQRVPIDRTNGMASAMDINVNGIEPLLSLHGNNIEKTNGIVHDNLSEFIEMAAPIAQAAAPVFQPQAPVAAPPAYEPPVFTPPAYTPPAYVAPEPIAAPAYTPPAFTPPAYEPPVYTPPVYAAPVPPPPPPVAPMQPEPVRQPEAVKQPEPIKFSMENVQSFSSNGNGTAEKAQAPVMEQQQTAPATPPPVALYEEKPKSAPPALDENAQMTDASLKEYVLNSKLLKEIDSQISARAGAKMNDEIDIEGDVDRLRFLKVFSLKQLHERLTDNKTDLIAFAEKWIGKDNGGSFDMGISLFYLEYLLVGKKNDPGFAVEYVLKFISDNDYSARYIIPTYNSIRQGDSGVSKFSHLTLK